ncbi:putative beta-lysine N-acetyltransferase [Clostridium boliviensis]|uniref:Beta-lysine N-acetyltransferase n=1 Tax=Clostridium boliviensis TaxID=318465 RepID=A0ABU4GEX8_9CLOT|nr:putative beta-lysine N-acetyltransferase [Clostridium boliviensis]MDW2796173.1 putative beta-lysine N-acetyltransferase [Clostridium boliviensis]
MKKFQCDIEDNCYFTIDKVKIYLDHMNKRVKILDSGSIPIQTLDKIKNFASVNQAGKILCNTVLSEVKLFTQAGFCIEGKIDGFFKGADAYCVSYFMDSKRKISENPEQKDKIIAQCLMPDTRHTAGGSSTLSYSIRTATQNDIGEIVALFSTVFSTYPTPVYDEEYIRQTMNEKILYKVAQSEGKIIGMASADMDSKNRNAEMTDCATYPDYRGKGVLSNIIHELEEELKNRKFIALYSLSRAVNVGVNMALCKHQYKYRGRLINNCNICGAFEDMNIWVKSLDSF